jgi:hypothetical protein
LAKQDRTPGTFEFHGWALIGNEPLEAGEEHEMNIMPHVLPLLSHSQKVSYSSVIHRKGEPQKNQNILSNSDNDMDEVNLQDFIHNASQLCVA